MNTNNSTQTETNKADLVASMTWDEKKKAAVEDYKNGRPRKSIAQEYGRSEATISSWARQAGCPERARGSRSATTPSDRDQQILRQRREGIPVKQVAKEFSLSVSTIFSVCKKWVAWVEPPPPVNGEQAGLMPAPKVDVDADTALHDADAPQSAIAGETEMSDSLTPAAAESVALVGISDGTVELEPGLSGAHQAVVPPPVIGVREVEDTDDLEPGPFPIHALSPVMRKIAEETALVRGIAVELPGMAAVATFAGALGKGWRCVGAVNGQVTFGNLYVVVGAGQSYGKGAAAEIFAPLKNVSNEMADQFCREQRPVLRTERRVLERKQKQLLDALTNPKDCGNLEAVQAQKMHAELACIDAKIAEIDSLVALVPTYWIGNVTTAALTGHLARKDQALTSYSPEAGELVRVVLGKFNRRERADFDLYLSGHSVESYRETRVGRGDITLMPCVSLLWLCQPCILRELVGNTEALKRGLAARCLSFVVEAGEMALDDGVVRSVSEPARRDWDELVRAILTARGEATEPIVISCSLSAREVFRRFFNESAELQNGPFQDLEGALGRWCENAIRIAVGQCVADNFANPTIHAGALTLTEDQARRAVEIARWCCRSGLKVGSVSRRRAQLELCDKLCKLLSAQAVKRMTLRVLRDHHGIYPAQVELVAQAFPDRLVLKDHKPPTGRPSRVLFLTHSAA